jgi:peptidyl-prolyl cis-trans isomerase A (cyclophilin A)
MHIRFALLLLALAPAALAAQALPNAPQAEGLVRVALTTSMGVVTLDLEAKRAPVTTANFLRYVDQKRFDGIVFYRAMKLGPDQGLVQAGAQGDPKRVLKPIKHEPTNITGVTHVAGAISMARWAPGTATGDFSILVSAMPGLDADPSQPSDNVGFAAFGHVVYGMDVLRKILVAPTSPTKGEGFMKGQMIAAPVKILTARRVRVIPAKP